MITTVQREFATSPDKIVGSAGGRPLYSVSVSLDALERVQQLSSLGECPSWWLMDSVRAQSVVICTLDPVWFLELQDQIRSIRQGVVG